MLNRIFKRVPDTPTNPPASPPKATAAPPPNPPPQTQAPAPQVTQGSSGTTGSGGTSSNGNDNGNRNPPANPPAANPTQPQANGNNSPSQTQAPNNNNAPNANSNPLPTAAVNNGVAAPGSTVIDGNTVTPTNAPSVTNSAQNNAINFTSGGFIAVYVIAALIAFGCFLYLILNTGKRKPNSEAFSDLHPMDGMEKFAPSSSRSPNNSYSAVPKLEDIPVFTEEVASQNQSLDSGPTRIEQSPKESLYLSTNAPGWSGKRPGAEPIRAQSQRYNRPAYMAPVRSLSQTQQYTPNLDQDRQYTSPVGSKTYGNDQDVWGYSSNEHYSYPSTYTNEDYEKYNSQVYQNQQYSNQPYSAYRQNGNYDENAIWEGQPSYRY
ncbi:hypothetical protein HK103_005927 [Boothiomyces macroporosus]|uniref:Uncharacterized protein n=1 Tax=Boothiomyces macroporosus TaxID=261099 RepID=A0AAD5UP10_9FUNG|nr:hypothetical protein HK103_005927 [Boothiomyces macroporosus]